MSEPRGLTPDCLVETAEGPVEMSDTAKKGFAVLTRLPTGQLGFSQLIKVERSGPVPLVRVTLDSGHAVVAAAGHPFVRAGGDAVAARLLQPGDTLETAYHYPAGYVPSGVTGSMRGTSIAVVSVEPAGEGEILTGTVRDTHVMFLTAGVMCGE